jgi:hypothetical protein
VAHEVDPGSAVGSSCDQPQPVDTTLRWPTAPDGRQPGAHGRCIREQSLGKDSQFLHAALLHVRDPRVEIVAVTSTDHATEGLDLMIHTRYVGIEVEEVRKEGPRGWTWLLRCCEDQACRAQGGSWGRTALVLVLGLAGRRRALGSRGQAPSLRADANRRTGSRWGQNLWTTTPWLLDSFRRVPIPPFRPTLSKYAIPHVHREWHRPNYLYISAELTRPCLFKGSFTSNHTPQLHGEASTREKPVSANSRGCDEPIRLAYVRTEVSKIMTRFGCFPLPPRGYPRGWRPHGA